MLLKLLTLLGVIVTLYGALQRSRSFLGIVSTRAGHGDAADLVRCRQCGAWHDPAQFCACRIPYTP